MPMRELLRRVGWRYGISIGLIVVVAGIVVVARFVGGSAGAMPYPRLSDTLPSLDALGDDGVEDNNEPTDGPTEFGDDSVVLNEASAFVGAWVRSDLPAAEWLAGLRPHATEDLIEQLADVDPQEVPAYATAGEPEIRSRSATYADVIVPIATHDALALGLVNSGAGWLVASVDRETG